jgi:hypothetical protein
VVANTEDRMDNTLRSGAAGLAVTVASAWSGNTLAGLHGSGPELHLVYL